jgi:multicomponent Na+:H+ antiporter subunit B
MIPDRQGRGMTLIVKSISRITLGFIILYGVYITFNGDIGPGGGFAGGIIVALAFIQIMLAFGKEVALKRLRAGRLRLLIGLAAIFFLYIATGRCAMGRCLAFDRNFFIPFFEMVVVGGGLFAIFVALVLLSKADKDSE